MVRKQSPTRKETVREAPESPVREPCAATVTLQSQAYEMRNNRTTLGVPQPYLVGDILKVARDLEQYSRQYGSFSVAQTMVQTEHTSVSDYAALQGLAPSERLNVGSAIQYRADDKTLDVLVMVGRLENMSVNVPSTAFQERNSKQEWEVAKDGVKAIGVGLLTLGLGGLPFLLGGGSYMASKIVKHQGDKTGDTYCSLLFNPRAPVTVEKANAYRLLVEQMRGTSSQGGFAQEIDKGVEAAKKGIEDFRKKPEVKRTMEDLEQKRQDLKAKLDELLGK